MSSKLCAFVLCVSLSSSVWAYPPLQLYIELTPSGGVLKPPPGHYAGPVVISKPITIDGAGDVILDGEGDGTIITVKADNVVLRGLHITDSGGSHDTVDAGILIEGSSTIVENNTLDNVLFGIHLKNTSENIIRGNTVSSKNRDISIRGDGVRMWYSHDNLIENNTLQHVRDLALNNSSDNIITANTIIDSRISMEFIFSPGNEVSHNVLARNITGIVVIYSNEMDIHHNRISNMRELTGAGLSFKESADVMVHDNEVAHCAIGLQANSPLDPQNRMTTFNNLFAYNVLGMYFYGEKGGHIVRDNRFESNFTDVMGSAARTVRDNEWGGNQWDKYQGFDSDKDGVGDVPHTVYFYSENVWKDNPMVRFFRGSPVMEMLDVTYRLAPFTEPVLEYSDPTPSTAER